MSEKLSFIETQFPVSKVSKESYKERKANNGQTLTGLGKWWGRKPLILVRAALIGCLMPAGENAKKDTEIFLKILSMDNEGLLLRKEKKIPVKRQYEIIKSNKTLSEKYLSCFINNAGKISLISSAPKEKIELDVFNSLGYDEKLNYCVRPEQLENISSDAWNDINQYLGTSAHSLTELVNQLSMKRYGHNTVVGDCFCGGGSIPFEAARMGFDVCASDLNPIAGLLTWADINILGANDKELEEILTFQKQIVDEVDKEILDLGIESNENGDRAVTYLYCIETKCPECGTLVPLIPTFVIGKGTKTTLSLIKKQNGYDFDVRMGVSDEEISRCENGTVGDDGLICPCCGLSTPISSIRHDTVSNNGKTIFGLREWEKNEFESRNDDVFHERLYAIKYEKPDGSRYYRAPNNYDIKNEEKVRSIVSKNLNSWQSNGYIPDSEITPGVKTSELIRSRGWKYWHQVFNARQLLSMSLFMKRILKSDNTKHLVVGALGINRCADFNSKLSVWLNSAVDEHGKNTFLNQALNPLYNHATRAFVDYKNTFLLNRKNINFIAPDNVSVLISDAKDLTQSADVWITDPPYADAVMYHELSEYFLAWDKTIIKKAFANWYTDSKRVLAVKGDEHFSQTMIDIYSNLTEHMLDLGLQVVMFTHSDPAVWAQLAVIMWKSNLQVKAAWNIATETDAAGYKKGNYVKGTVLLVLRKQTSTDTAFLDEINVDIRSEVKKQIANMQEIDDKDEPNFADPDYVLAAYAASLKVLTSYAEIEDLDLDYELNQAITNPSGSKIVAIIENAKKVAYDCVIPLEFDGYLWRDLTNAEKFYIKGIESEKHGNYQIGTYQEFARGFSIAGYSQLMASERANTARLKTPFEMAGRSMNDVPDFESSLMRSIFQAIYAGVKEDMNPNKALGFLKNDIQDYWDKREMIKQILSFLINIKNITNMQPHWTESAEMADQLLALVTHDSI